MSGLRVDGRRPAEVRRVRCALGVFPGADGSALVEHGNTKVLAAVYGPREARRRGNAEHDQAVVSVEYTVAPFAGAERRGRPRGGGVDRRAHEAATALRQTFEAVVLAKQYPRSEILVSVCVLQSDGGAVAAAVNAGTAALVDAGVALRDFAVGCSLTYLQRTALLGEDMGKGGGKGWRARAPPRSLLVRSHGPCHHLSPLTTIAHPFCLPPQTPTTRRRRAAGPS